MQSIASEDIGINFTLSPDYRHYELVPLQKSLKLRLKLRRRRRSSLTGRLLPHLQKNIGRSASAEGISTEKRKKPRRQPEFRPRFLLFASFVFRFGALFPTRLALLICSFIFLFVCCIVNLFWPFSPLTRTYLAVIYCRMYTLGCGFIIRFHGTDNRPTRPGVICANHLSPNDVHVMFADIPLNRDYLYLVTGQKHSGVIGALEKLIDKMCPSLWLERSDPESRRQFSVDVLKAARKSGPVILFPEGYCTNNSQVLQFRKAVFQKDIIVYPVAIKQESRYGDSYWKENYFFMYLLRVLTSWAIVYNVHYLAPQKCRPLEPPIEFAARIQRIIASRVGVRAAPSDGGIWYKELERWKAKAEWQRRCATELGKCIDQVSQNISICLIVHITFKKIIGEVILHIFSKYLSSNKIYLIEFFIFLLIIFLYNTKFIRIIL
uniref:Phospholipid/glycerol acyltransferase domain-containing protein n=1 Tax=Meloidogyne incognita TaxID=6306 RepID=A0A914LU01_MELIC